MGEKGQAPSPGPAGSGTPEGAGSGTPGPAGMAGRLAGASTMGEARLAGGGGSGGQAQSMLDAAARVGGGPASLAGASPTPGSPAVGSSAPSGGGEKGQQAGSGYQSGSEAPSRPDNQKDRMQATSGQLRQMGDEVGGQGSSDAEKMK